jgi:hypothetical protein
MSNSLPKDISGYMHGQAVRTQLAGSAQGIWRIGGRLLHFDHSAIFPGFMYCGMICIKVNEKALFHKNDVVLHRLYVEVTSVTASSIREDV